MSPKTQAALDAIIAHTQKGEIAYPFMFTHDFGRATAAAAFRVAKKRGLIEQDGLDGVGNPCYRAPRIPAGTTLH